MYICVSLSHFAVQQKLSIVSQRYFNLKKTVRALNPALSGERGTTRRCGGFHWGPLHAGTVLRPLPTITMKTHRNWSSSCVIVPCYR